ncbi:MAG: rhodanese-like domain-containing protein [Alphaproteobacteria bacterium]|nr:rhodanese-like domain-containing protein [Alphaproteobacteria bacterium]
MGATMAMRDGMISWLARAATALWDRGPRPATDSKVADVAWIEAGDLSARLGRGSQPVVIDVRGADEFRGALGHIQDARNMPLDQLPGRLPELAAHKGSEITLVCRTQMRSAQAAGLLREAGFGTVSVLRGGMEQWKKSGLPIADPQP